MKNIKNLVKTTGTICAGVSAGGILTYVTLTVAFAAMNAFGKPMAK